jgi:osmotically-inducible protein OsmY
MRQLPNQSFAARKDWLIGRQKCLRTPLLISDEQSGEEVCGVMTDLKLRQDVLDELEFEPSVDAAGIGVQVNDGVVTLTGHVLTYAEKLAAERAAKRVSGVRAVAQEITIRYPGEAKLSDEEIARRALNILEWDVSVPDNVQVTVENGLLTLTGEVDWHYQKAAAETAIQKLCGIVAVFNNIKLKRPQVKVSEVKSKIENALKRHAVVEADGISVTVSDGKVTLRGKVDSWKEREAIATAAWSAAGVQTVEDHLIVSR